MKAEKNKKLLSFAFFVAVATWTIMAYATIGDYMSQGILFARRINGRVYINDFASYYSAGLLARHCLKEKINIYDVEIQEASLDKIVAPQLPELPFYLQYPPYFFALVLPLSFLSINQAWLIWISLGITYCFCALRLLGNELFSTNKEKALSLLLVFASFPAWLSIELGQTALFFFPTLIMLLLFLKNGKPYLTGSLFAFSLIKPQYAPVIGSIGLITGKWKFVLSAFVSLSLILILSSSILGTENILRYPQALLVGETTTSVSGVSAQYMQNLRGQLTLIIGSDTDLLRQISLLVLGLCIAFIFWFWAIAYKSYAKIETLAFPVFAAISILLMLTTSPHCHSQDYLSATAACIWLWVWSARPEKTSLRLKTIRSLCLSFPLLSWIFYFLRPLFESLQIAPYFLWAVLLAGLSLAEVFSQLSCQSKVRASI